MLNEQKTVGISLQNQMSQSERKSGESDGFFLYFNRIWIEKLISELFLYNFKKISCLKGQFSDQLGMPQMVV